MKYKFLIRYFFMINIINIMVYGEDIPLAITPSKDAQLDGIVAYSRTLKNMPKGTQAKGRLKGAISLMDSKGLNALKTHPSYASLGDVYMYGGIYLSKDLKADEIIRLYDMALSLRSDPNSHYRIAVLYKQKYDDAIKKEDLKKEIEYGKKIYFHLSQYIKLSGFESKKYKDLIKYFSMYNF